MSVRVLERYDQLGNKSILINFLFQVFSLADINVPDSTVFTTQNYLS
ncbi:MAG: hypothetical protein HN542_09565 [Flavobacteriales bacterium]|nr:hypothetical protein [Flavobacteriales bacterium]MBT3963304.1 hypothetical protein [Flavobacteriales bacterium]MBT4930817.1 hypothetical protein [Flavobacteriales bacterium]MBT5132150.1 hypothetical protein [Flavobacteriales bacterium]MBT5976297.1 hypothetical protein [Flavobacteriales bacterium]